MQTDMRLTQAYRAGFGPSLGLYNHCLTILAKIKEEERQAVIALRLHEIALIVSAISAGLAVFVTHYWTVSVFELSRLQICVVSGLMMALAAVVTIWLLKGATEISRELYATLIDLRADFPDLDGLHCRYRPLTLESLKINIKDLANTLGAEIAHPQRTQFLHPEPDKSPNFCFNH